MATLATQVRRIIRQNGLAFDCMWTNKYENCRTVKCYVNSRKNFDEHHTKTIDALNKWASENNIKISTKIIKRRGGQYMPDSFIVRIPFEN